MHELHLDEADLKKKKKKGVFDLSLSSEISHTQLWARHMHSVFLQPSNSAEPK